MLTCKQATKLISQSQDQQLPFSERTALKMHLLMCSGCKNYKKQLGIIRKACLSIGAEEEQS